MMTIDEFKKNFIDNNKNNIEIIPQDEDIP
jgi:hypothetical protein